MKYGFIGCGNMASAILGGMLKAGLAAPDEIIASAKTEKTREAVSARFGIRTTAENRETAEADTVFLCVKPQVFPGVAEELRGANGGKLFVSILAGKTVAELSDALGGRDTKIVRVMPNTPALVGEAMSALCASETVSEDELSSVVQIFRALGRAEVLPESLFSAVTAVSGSSPAYVFLLIEAMADGAVQAGMPRKTAYEFAAQAVLGSAKMVLETGRHPGELKDMVCSPAGTTIDAVAVLEELGFRSAVIEAERACVERAEEL